jgi:thermitase
MAQIRFYSAGRMVSVQAKPAAAAAAGAPRPSATAARSLTADSGALQGEAAAITDDGGSAPVAQLRLHDTLQTQASRMAPMFHDLSAAPLVAAMAGGAAAGTLVFTETLVLDHASLALLRHLRRQHGLELLREGSHGKCLLKAPEGGAAGVAQVAAAARDAHERSQGRSAAHPNFVRLLRQPRPLASGQARGWHLRNDGSAGLLGADAAAAAAWTLSRGDAAVRVAVLDEGVDTGHPALKAGVVAERDFVDGNAHARPDGDDAHGTACAGVAVSRSRTHPGVAPGCSLVAARIAKGDGHGYWVFDDFDTADAIDWCWDEAAADVLSNSWGGGPPVDAISNAFARARRQGRGGRGAVVVCATGNENGAIGYPATLDEVLSVGASTPWDTRKSPATPDGEAWGSNFGDAIDLVAPGVWIACADIRGAAGYGPGAYTDSFNGTSSATPQVAAAAALVLSLVPRLGEAAVRQILQASCDRIGRGSGWNRQVGHGRLNVHAALRLALRHRP